MKTIGEIRRANLERLIAEFGTMEALADAAGTSSVYLSQVRRQAIDAKTGKAREIGSKIARRLEAAARPPKASGWMDVDHSQPSTPPPVPPRDFSDRRHVSESDWALLQDIKLLPPEELAAIRERLAQFRRVVDEEVERRLSEIGKPRT